MSSVDDEDDEIKHEDDDEDLDDVDSEDDEDMIWSHPRLRRRKNCRSGKSSKSNSNKRGGRRCKRRKEPI